MQMLSSEYKIDQPKMGLKKGFFLLVGLAVVLILVGVVYYFTKINQAATSDSRQIQFTVAKGLSTREIATQLTEQKIINNKYIFIIYSKLHGVGDKIQAGTYSLNSNMTVAQIVSVLTHGLVVDNTRAVTIIEGLTNTQIGKYLSSQGVTTENDFEQTLANKFNTKYSAIAAKYNYQGFLFPDTYKLTNTATASDLVKLMLKNFENKVTDKMVLDAANNHHELAEIVTLASIIEKEVGRNKTNLTDEDLSAMQKEREMVASIFYNRLEIGMPLESDATVNYITGKADRSVTIADTKIKSPFNTYQVKGLPPSPISNPGLGSIKAAVYPANSDFLYFLNAPDGTAYYAKTLAGHNANRAKYLK